jgi:DNA-binding Lrp family transcriptional regulator
VDEIDIAIGRSLMLNSRMSYSDMGKALGLTPQAVHHRVQELMDAGIITHPGTYISEHYHGDMWIVVNGWSRAPSMDQVASRLEKDRRVAVFFVASGNFVYVHGMVKDASDMAGFVSMVQKEVDIRELQVGILPTPPASKESFSKLDMRIVKALESDARRPISDVAKEVGVTVKTARKRLDRMTDERLIVFSIHWRLDSQSDPITNIHLTIREDVDKEKVAFSLIKKLSAGVIRTMSFSNLPNQLIITLWTRNNKETHRICQELEHEGPFVSVVPNILQAIYYFEEHRTRYLKQLMESASKLEGMARKGQK